MKTTNRKLWAVVAIVVQTATLAPGTGSPRELMTGAL